MPAQDEWIVFLESSPVYWKLSQSKIMVNVLQQFAKEALTMEAIYFKYPKIPLSDLEEILNTFVSARLVVKRMIAGTIIFALTPEGKKFLELYKKAEKSFTIK
jgi:predicted transcriptional regulator